MPRKHIRHTIGATYACTLDVRGLYHFLRSQGVAPASIARLTVIIDQHREHAWNTLWLPDGVYDVSTVTILVSTNWIAEDVYWEVFCDAQEPWPFWLILTAFSLARVLRSNLRQPKYTSTQEGYGNGSIAWQAPVDGASWTERSG